jgi:hypothetical protein
MIFIIDLQHMAFVFPTYIYNMKKLETPTKAKQVRDLYC